MGKISDEDSWKSYMDKSNETLNGALLRIEKTQATFYQKQDKTIKEILEKQEKLEEMIGNMEETTDDRSKRLALADNEAKLKAFAERQSVQNFNPRARTKAKSMNSLQVAFK